MERLDILTPEGSPTGRTKLKSEVHRDGDWHLAVHIWIQRPDGAMLMQRRSPQKENDPNLWDISVAGHVSAGESALTAAVREVAEEIGLIVSPDQLQPLVRLSEARILNGGTYIDNEWHQIYLLRVAPVLATLTLQQSEVAEVRWVDWDTFVKDVTRRPANWVAHWHEYEQVVSLLLPS